MEEVTTEDTQRKRGREDDNVNVDDDASSTTVAVVATASAVDAVAAAYEDLKCGICLELVENATQTSCCGGLWCRGCIEQIKEKKCPNCREDIEDDTITRDTRNERLSAALSRSCKNQPRGCSFSGNRKEMHEHSQTCRHASLDDLRAELAAAKADLTEFHDRTEANKSAAVAHLQSKASHTISLAAALGYDDIFTVLLKEGLVHKQKCPVNLQNGPMAEASVELSVSRSVATFVIDTYITDSFRKTRLHGLGLQFVELNSDGREERCHEMRVSHGIGRTSWFHNRQFTPSDKETVFAMKVMR